MIVYSVAIPAKIVYMGSYRCSFSSGIKKSDAWFSETYAFIGIRLLRRAELDSLHIKG